MKSASVRDLRVTFPKVEKWLNAGESIAITKRNRVVGVLVPPGNESPVIMPNFASRMADIFPPHFRQGDEFVEKLLDDRDAAL